MEQLRILVVDDSSFSRNLIRGCLAPLEAHIVEAVNGKEALRLAFTTDFDIVVTDVEMPEMNGLQLCRQLKTYSDTKGIPVVIISDFHSEKDIDRGFQSGAEAYLSKADMRAELVGTVKRILKDYHFRSSKTVLVVDDTLSVLKIVEYGLTVSGFQVVSACNGKQALLEIDRKRPDLILSDINMPEMNGYELLEAVRGRGDTASVPFVVMSGYTDRRSMKSMISKGAAAYITKPFNLDELVILVEKLLSDQFRLLLAERERLDSERTLLLAGITSLVSALEARDAYTKGHSESVARILAGMAGLAGASQEQVELLNIAGRLHDIGKIGVPDALLLKPGALEPAEYELIKQHPTVGANIIRSVPSLSNVLPVVLHHHERIDGKGYPDGLKGTQIPQWSRMAAVADTFDALTSNRPYRSGMPEDRALQIIEDARGTQLCPESVELFTQWHEPQPSASARVPLSKPSAAAALPEENRKSAATCLY